MNPLSAKYLLLQIARAQEGKQEAVQKACRGSMAGLIIASTRISRWVKSAKANVLQNSVDSSKSASTSQQSKPGRKGLVEMEQLRDGAASQQE